MNLPEPDIYGNYWLTGGGNRAQGPCVLHSKAPGKWFASAGSDGGVVFSGRQIAYFENPYEALTVLEERLAYKKPR